MPEAVKAALVNTIGETEMRDVRLVGINANVARVPAEVRVEFAPKEVSVQQDESEIVARFVHGAEFTSVDGEPVASIALTHSAHFTYAEGFTLDDESVRDWVFHNVYFMVYPYVRQALQDTCLRLGLPAVVLGYLKRGQQAPENITMVVTSTMFERPGESLPFEQVEPLPTAD